MTRSLRLATLGTESNDVSKHSRSSRPLGVRRLERTRHAPFELAPFVICLTDCGTGNGQVNVVAQRFMTALQNYTQVEKDYRQKQRARVERQIKIGQLC